MLLSLRRKTRRRSMTNTSETGFLQHSQAPKQSDPRPVARRTFTVSICFPMILPLVDPPLPPVTRQELSNYRQTGPASIWRPLNELPPEGILSGASIRAPCASMRRNESHASKCIPQKHTPFLWLIFFQARRVNLLAVMIFSSAVDPAEPSVTGLRLSNQAASTS